MPNLLITLMNHEYHTPTDLLQLINNADNSITGVIFCCNYVSRNPGRIEALIQVLKGINNNNIINIGFKSTRMNVLRAEEFTGIIHSLPQTIRKINLESNLLGVIPDSIAPVNIMSIIPGNIDEVHLGSNKLANDGHSALCEIITGVQNKIKLLNLKDNNIGRVGINGFELIMKAFKNQPLLDMIDLSTNHLEQLGTVTEVLALLKYTDKQFIFGLSDFEQELTRRLNSEQIIAFATSNLITFVPRHSNQRRNMLARERLPVAVVREINSYLPKSFTSS